MGNTDESLDALVEKGAPEAVVKVIKDVRNRQDLGDKKLEEIGSKLKFLDTNEGKTIFERASAEMQELRDEMKAQKEEQAKIEKKLLLMQAPGAASASDGIYTDDEKYMIIEKSVRNLGREKLGLSPVVFSGREEKCTFVDMEQGTYEEKAVATTNLPRAGALLLPAEMGTRLIDTAIQEYSDLGGLADEITINAQNYVLPRETAHGATNWHYEQSTRTKDGSYRVGTKTYTTYGLNSYFDATREMLMYSKYPLLKNMNASYGRNFAVKLGTAYVNGSATQEPGGFMNDPDVASVNQEEADDITNGDYLKKVFYSLKPFYRKKAVWAMNDLTSWKLSVLKAGDGHYILRSLNEEQDGRILNREVRTLIDMPDVGAGLYPIIFADWKNFYLIVKQAGGDYSIVDIYTSKANGIVEYMHVIMAGGGTKISEAAKKLKIAET